MEEEITDIDDYVDWLKRVSDAEQSRQAMYESPHYATISMWLQVHQAEDGNLDHNSTKQLASSNHDEMSTRWREIC
jgi:hypothetical protein